MPRTKPKRETSDRVSRYASEILNDLKKPRNTHLYDASGEEVILVYVSKLEAVCASALAQDVTKGPRRKGRK